MLGQLRKTIIAVICIFYSAFNFLIAQEEIAIITESSLYYDKFENGFSYYIKPAKKDSGKVYLKLLVKVGSLQQDADQPSMAHFLEHMASKGGTHFPEGFKMDEFAEKNVFFQIFTAGKRYVQYDLSVPKDNEHALETALLFYNDILTGLKLRKEDVDSERGVVKQEMVYKIGNRYEERALESKLEKSLFPCLLNTGDFFENLDEFPRESLVRYYRDWYRPELMTLIVSGDVGEKKMVTDKIKETFGKIPPAKNPRKPKACDSLYFAGSNKFVILKKDTLRGKHDKSVEIQMFYRDPETIQKISSAEGLKRKYMWTAITRILNKRFKEESEFYLKSYDILSRYSYTSHPAAFSIKVSSPYGEGSESLNKALSIVKQFKTYGFTSGEWNQAKDEVLRGLKALDSDDPSYWTLQIRDHEIYKEPLDIEKYKGLKDWLENLSFTAANNFLFGLLPKYPNDIGIMAPGGSFVDNYSKKEFREKLRQANEIPVKPYQPPNTPDGLMDVSEKEALEMRNFRDCGTGPFGERIIELSNGVKVVLKENVQPIGLNKEEISIHGFRPKGAAFFGDSLFYSAINAPGIIKNTGTDSLNKFELNRFLKGKSIWQGVNPYIKNNETGIRGSTKPEDLEELFQLIYLYFTVSRKDETAYKDWRQNRIDLYKEGRHRTIISDLQDAISEYTGDRSELPKGFLVLEGIKKTEMEEAYAIYHKLFSNAEDFTFIISGALETEEVLPLVRKYLGNLPNSGKKITDIKKSKNVKEPKTPIYKEFSAPYPNKSSLYKVKFSQNDINNYSWREELKLNLLGILMNNKIQDLRYEYDLSIYNAAAYGKYENNKYTLQILIDCIPEEFRIIRQICMDFYSQLKKGKFDDSFFDSSKKKLVAFYKKQNLNKNSKLQERLYEYYSNGKNYPKYDEVIEYISDLKKDDLIKTAVKYFKPINRSEFVWEANKL
ncbi:M16 family metallopeptidase [Autumnicola musiva]|uniref:Insulinase family protein n=1 Tax=Autumnicola musiva TaxID=3075589 RepID=A0ABU3D4L7_9FLAO|nr:insulinase family protein [Zunongwangia sp. F117]MDT0676484.1 insulinase family protein [Zunongwangia sp. F117]